jgi:hypothetical protein
LIAVLPQHIHEFALDVNRKVSFRSSQVKLCINIELSSSLRLLEEAAGTLETDIAGIKDLIKENAPEVRRIEHSLIISELVVDDEPLPATLRIKLMQKAEASRPWLAVGLEEWIRIGRWWLLKVCTSCLTLAQQEQF